MQVTKLRFGKITIDGQNYSKDIIIDHSKIVLRDKSASKKLKGHFGHTPLSIEENIPWNCKRLIIGSGFYGSLPVMQDIFDKAKELDVEISIKSTPEAVKHIGEKNTNFILHLTC